jgi:transposase-like protein
MTIDDEARRRIARGWASTSLDQRTYAAQHGISPRTLRQWVRQFGMTARPEVRVREVVERAIADLTALLASLDADVARREDSPEGVGESPEPVTPERSTAAAADTEAKTAREADRVAPRAMPAAGVYWF